MRRFSARVGASCRPPHWPAARSSTTCAAPSRRRSGRTCRLRRRPRRCRAPSASTPSSSRGPSAPVGCAQLEVPIDYAEPDGATIELAVLMVPATSGSRLGARCQSRRPGGSGVDYARAAAFGAVVTAPCIASTTSSALTRVASGDRRPSTVSTGRNWTPSWRRTPPPTPMPSGQQPWPRPLASERRAPRRTILLLHVSTAEAGQGHGHPSLPFGRRQAHLPGQVPWHLPGRGVCRVVPEHVGRLVLDGAIDPTLTSERLNLGQAVGFERATLAWAEACAAEQGCPSRGRHGGDVRGLGDLLRELDSKPLTVTGTGRCPRSPRDGPPTAWRPRCTTRACGTSSAKPSRRPPGRRLRTHGPLADRYADRNPGGTYSTNPHAGALGRELPGQARAGRRRGTGGPTAAAHRSKRPCGAVHGVGSLVCATWPQPARRRRRTRPPSRLLAPDRSWSSGRPVTPRRPTSGRWAWPISREGDVDHLRRGRHTAYTRSNQCVDDAVDNWFIDGVVPAADLRC